MIGNMLSFSDGPCLLVLLMVLIMSVRISFESEANLLGESSPALFNSRIT